ncbi:IolE/MocC family protein [Chitinimonas naiadis]
MQFDVKIGINPISWSNDDLPSLGGEIPLDTALREGRQIGYQGFELGNKFPKAPAALKAKLAEYDMACVSGWYSGRLASGTVADEIEQVREHMEKLVYNGATVMVYGEVADAIQGLPQPLFKRPQFRSEADWLAYGERLNAFGRHLQSNGITLAYHHHMGAYVESPADIDRLMAVTGPEVGLLFDTGHATFGGGDALALLQKHLSRVVHVHCKDVRPHVVKLARNRQWTFLQSVINGAFTVPGDGSIDFPALLQLLARHGYRGWLVVEAEQDPAVAPSYEYADKGYRHLAQIVESIRRDAYREAA